MHKIRLHRTALVTGLFLATFALPTHAAFDIDNLVTDAQSAHAAQITDAGLINAWGLSYAPTGPFWVSANSTGTSPLYSVDPATQVISKLALTVTIPGTGNVTGQVFNSTNAFNGDRFLFVSEDGTVSGWRSALGTTAETLAVASATSLYKGAAFSTIAGDSYLYAANFHTGAVDVYKGSALSPSLSGTFTDPSLPSGYAPFNIQNLGDKLYVTYAQQDSLSSDEVAGPGLGLVDSYDLQGNFLARIATGGSLNAPWGLAIAPSSFGSMAGALLVGNFGDGHINAFDLVTHAFLGQVLGNDGKPLAIDGLWAIAPGNDGLAGSSHLLYFTAGPDDESHGLFGVLTPVPEPSIYAMLLIGFVVIGNLAVHRNPN
ncbi:MAG: TIGR03118 family protein [Proteobacteria bacterium]|nr:TIGR03118 family protein [Pseudomonadota bacterium]